MRRVLLMLALVGCNDQGVSASLDELTVLILSHRTGDVVSAGVPITFRGLAGATESAPEAIDVAWYVDGEAVCLDTPDSDSLVQCTTALPAGPIELTLAARIPRDEAQTEILLTVEPGISAPQVEITSPAASSTADEGELVFFEGEVSDAETLAVDLQVEWTSSLDGVLDLGAPDGNGRTSGALALSVGDHLITLSATDTDGNVGTDSALLTIRGEGGTDPDTEADTDPDTDTEADTEPDTEADTDPDGFDYSLCGGIGAYERVLPLTSTGMFHRVAYAPDGSYALILERVYVSGGYTHRLWRYDPVSNGISEVASSTEEQWLAVEFATEGYALIGGGTEDAELAPRLYTYTEDEGLVALAIPALGDGGMVANSRVIALDQDDDGLWAVLADNEASSNNILYLNELRLSDELAATWEYGGGTSSFTSATWRPQSVSWGRNLGGRIALTANTQTAMFMYDADLPSGRWSSQSRGGLGNHGQVMFDPVDREVAWMINGSGNVYAWEGTMMGSGNQYDFGNLSPRRFTTSPDGHWKVFVGGYGAVHFSDSPWTPIRSADFAAAPVANWSDPPWSGGSGTGFNDVAWRPGTCGGLIVGDATANRSMLVRWLMQ